MKLDTKLAWELAKLMALLLSIAMLSVFAGRMGERTAGKLGWVKRRAVG